MTYIETPHTDGGNATYLSNGNNLENFSVENSFLSPSKRKDDLISQLRNGRGFSLKTPRARGPLKDLHNLPAASAQGEFTPLLQSGLRKNLIRNGKPNGAPATPAFLKAGFKGGKSPALPAAEVSAMYGYDEESSGMGEDDGTPVPQIASSSAQSTPLAVLPKRDAGGVLQDQGQMMTLREQENVRVASLPHFVCCNTNACLDYKQGRKGELWTQAQDSFPGGIITESRAWIQRGRFEGEYRSKG